MKKVLNIVFVCVAVLSSCAKTINDDTNYYYINGEQYYRVPQDYYTGYNFGGKYIETFSYLNTKTIHGLNPIQTYHTCDQNCPSLHHPSKSLVGRLEEIRSGQSQYDDNKYYLIAEFAYTFPTESEMTDQGMQIDYIVSPWRIARCRMKEITIYQNGKELETKVIEIIDDYVE